MNHHPCLQRAFTFCRRRRRCLRCRPLSHVLDYSIDNTLLKGTRKREQNIKLYVIKFSIGLQVRVLCGVKVVKHLSLLTKRHNHNKEPFETNERKS